MLSVTFIMVATLQALLSFCKNSINISHTDKHHQLGKNRPASPLVSWQTLVKHWCLNLPMQVLSLMQFINKMKQKKLKE